jgi:uncharacterized protein (DUF2062 family)
LERHSEVIALASPAVNRPRLHPVCASLCYAVSVSLRDHLLAARGTLRRWTAALVHEHASPGRIGAAVAFGVWVGCSPFYGVQTLVGLALAPALRLNRLAVLLGLQISIPPVAPFLLFANAQVGALILQGQWLPLSVAALRAIPTSKLVTELFLDLLVGGALVGAALGLALGFLTTYLVRRRRRNEVAAPPGQPRML